MSRWGELTMAQKSELIGIAVKQGITDLNTVREMYNNSSPIESNVSGSRRFDDGGFVKKNKHKHNMGGLIDSPPPRFRSSGGLP